MTILKKKLNFNIKKLFCEYSNLHLSKLNFNLTQYMYNKRILFLLLFRIQFLAKASGSRG